MTNKPATITFEQEKPRELFPAALRGLSGRCPNCGTGHMFRAFLKVADTCDHCGEELHHQRADDAPAYFVILIVGHLVVPLALAIEIAFAWPLWLHLMIWIPLIVGLALALLQPVKGTLVAWQWALRMHGFGPPESEPELAPVVRPDRRT